MKQHRQKQWGSQIWLPCLFLIGVLSFAGSAQVRKAGIDHMVLPDRFGRPMVGAMVNGVGPLPFIIDTGASKSVVYRSLTLLAGLDALPNQSKRILTATGYKRVLVYPATDFYMLGRSLLVEETVALPDIIGSEAKGLIGVDLLANLMLVVDMEGGSSRLTQPDTGLSGKWHMVQGRPVAYGSLALNVNIGGVDVPVIVDTGASDTVINSAGSKALTLAAQGLTKETIRASISNGRNREFVALRVPSFKLGEFERTDMRLVVSDIPVFTTLGARDVPAIILGMDLMGGQAFAVDFKNWRLYLRQSKPAGEQLD